ncbi:hypothetical protein ABZ816_24195 [Actinosynnema sp. NPDC047251]|uniref:TY-Chap N-terminal domain-containing protein n=1 Tax=Saccharothrix espanaensis (strain ATCC 51144 / DSM 44229 / JCM 9112 / NBRC 15066 / NRRL 15764) TaxID=1179773 RepID=K0K488_SACES|nr:hypothetical protein [Saccharothrix espanaensis]CCH32422.1 hypothetical protein BN6_51560 [Saccharothrix espanaensis DSM 44229]
MSEWAEFGRDLTEALRDVADRVFLIVFLPANPKVYVQFAGGQHEVEAQAAGPEVVPWADVSGMTEAGWVPPSGFDPPNWTFTLPVPALTAEYAALAQRCVVALRDVYQVSDPRGLVYKAWREGEWPAAAESWSDERIATRDVGENPLEMRWLKIPPAQG